ncbi:MAG TPA: hypothetical protein VFN57_02325, partial [Thermomicrobiaceae bacterium]|nr:hypothetical protein [Thermomicrobiaceae bacterium]
EDHVFALLVTFPEVLKSIAATLPEQDVLDGRNRELLDLLRQAPAEGVAAALDGTSEEVAAHLAALRAIVAERPGGHPGRILREAEEALQRLRRERHDLRLRQLMTEMVSAKSEGDDETVRQCGDLLRDTMARYPEFYPEPSPYFRDVRDAGGR